MAPTHRGEEIEGRAYKEYAYSPLPASFSPASCQTTTLGGDRASLDVGAHQCSLAYTRNSSLRINLRPAADMAEKGSTFLQYLAAAAGNLCIVMAGAMLAWSSPVLSKLKKDPVSDYNPLGVPITDDESSWVGSLVPLGATFGTFLAGYMVERWGRKRSLLFCVAPFLVGWTLIATARHLEQLYAARLLFGLALSIPFTVLPMYVGEIAETSIRGALGSFLQLFITIGLLFSYAVGPYLSYVYFAIACAALPIVFFLCFVTMPESPYFLLSQGRREEAVAVLARLRGKTPVAVQKEADEMQASVEEAFRSEVSISDLFKSKANLKALIYTAALAAFQQLTGINVVLFYMEDIFTAANTSLDTAISTIIVGVVQTSASLVTPFVVDRLGRRMLLLLSGVGEIVSLGALGLYFYLKDVQNDDVSSISWLPVVALMIFIGTYSVGWGPLPWAVMGEMFASNVKSKASGITVSVCWGLAFLITKFTSDITSAFGLHTAFWGFGLCCLLSVLFAVFVLPETKGKSLRQIQDELNGVKSSSGPGLDASSDADKK